MHLIHTAIVASSAGGITTTEIGHIAGPLRLAHGSVRSIVIGIDQPHESKGTTAIVASTSGQVTSGTSTNLHAHLATSTHQLAVRARLTALESGVADHEVDVGVAATCVRRTACPLSEVDVLAHTSASAATRSGGAANIITICADINRCLLSRPRRQGRHTHASGSGLRLTMGAWATANVVSGGSIGFIAVPLAALLIASASRSITITAQEKRIDARLGTCSTLSAAEAEQSESKKASANHHLCSKN